MILELLGIEFLLNFISLFCSTAAVRFFGVPVRISDPIKRTSSKISGKITAAASVAAAPAEEVKE